MRKFKIPNRKKNLITEEFLIDLRDELDRMFNANDRNSPPSFANFYSQFSSTAGFQETLKIVSEKHNVKKAIYEYSVNLPWHKSDDFENDLLKMMVSKEIIEEGDMEEDFEDYLRSMENDGIITIREVVKHHKGYNTIVREWNFLN